VAAVAPRQRQEAQRKAESEAGMKSFAIALGGGGARGLAHIAVLEAIDEMGVKPTAIAGTSIGALVGAAYAAGMSAKDIRRHVIAVAHDPGEIWRRLIAARAGSLSDLFAGAFGQATQLDAEKFCAQFLPKEVPADFSALQIPFIVMATDLHGRQEAALSSGLLYPALAASMALPGLFRPVVIDGRVMIDGGATNPLPFDQLFGRAAVVVGVDVFGVPPAEREDMPGAWQSVYTTVLIMGSAIIAAKHRHAAPDLMIRPNVGAFRTLDFYQASAILRASDAVKPEVRERLGGLISDAPERTP
jgi:NTE family protein